MFTRRRWQAPPEKRLLTPEQEERLAGWVRMLDVDLERAQQVLRLPVDQLPPVPGERAESPRVPLRGAYARRAQKKVG
jgi:hypothetical protein